MKIITDNEKLMRFVPNAIAPVKGESPLFDKIEAHIQLAENWLLATFMPESTLDAIALSEDDTPLKHSVCELIVADALIRSLPSLDLVLTPNGFGVVSTNTIGAASKHRIENLIESIRNIRDEAIEQALLLLPKAEAWADSNFACYFGSTLFPNIDLATLCGVTSARWEKYLELRSQCLNIELDLSEEYFSPELMSALRRQFLLGTLSAPQLKVVAAIRAQIVDVLNDKAIIANRMRDIVNYIRYNPDIFPQWHSSDTAKLFSPPKFENKKKSSGYWF